MFDIGFLELLIVAIISLLVLGPERLPVAARAAGRWVGKARRMVSQFSREIDRQMEIEELRQQLKEQGESLNINDDANKIHQTVNEALKEVNLSGSDLSTPLKPKPENAQGKAETSGENENSADQNDQITEKAPAANTSANQASGAS